MTGIVVAVVGLGFGEDFVPIYRAHPGVADVVLVDTDADRREAVRARFGLTTTYGSVDEALADPAVDAIHILAPVFLHADMAVAALDAGKHVACAVPMATTLEDLDRIIAAQERSGRNYMMMETSVYGREYLAVRDLHEADAFGALTLYRGTHVQNLDGFPRYWLGYPPMHYLTHALSPVLALLGTDVVRVSARGAGRLTPEHATGGFDNPFPTEVGWFELRDSDVVADVTMSFFQTARSYLEGFDLYGDRLGVEWPIDNEGPMTAYDMEPSDGVVRGNRVSSRALEPRDRPDLLPEALRPFVRSTTVRFSGMDEDVTVHAGHGGSHPFLVAEFVGSILDGRSPFVDARRSAAWTAPGICAHASALRGGAPVDVPRYQAA